MSIIKTKPHYLYKRPCNAINAYTAGNPDDKISWETTRYIVKELKLPKTTLYRFAKTRPKEKVKIRLRYLRLFQLFLRVGYEGRFKTIPTNEEALTKLNKCKNIVGSWKKLAARGLPEKSTKRWRETGRIGKIYRMHIDLLYETLPYDIVKYPDYVQSKKRHHKIHAPKITKTTAHKLDNYVFKSENHKKDDDEMRFN